MNLFRYFGFRLLVLVLLPLLSGTGLADDTTKTIGIGTDVAMLLVFHPDSLLHHKDDPIAWYSAPSVTRKDLEEGNLVGFWTGSDGGYRVRMTTGDLTVLEKEFSRCSADLRLKVEHGWVALDNSSGLPGEEQMSNPKGFPNRQFKLDNGNYRVTITGINWHKAPGGVDENGLSNKNSLPSYVVQFQPVEKLDEIKVPPCLPDLCGKEATYVAAEFAKKSSPIVRMKFDETKKYPLLLIDQALEFPRGTIRVTLDKTEAERLDLVVPSSAMSKERSKRLRETRDRTFIVAQGKGNGEIAAVCKIGPMGFEANVAKSLGLGVFGLVKLEDTFDDNGTLYCTAMAIPRKAEVEDPVLLQKLKDAFANYAKAKSIKASVYHYSLINEQPTFGHTNQMIFQQFKVPAERFGEYAVAADYEIARMLIEDMKKASQE